MAITKAKKTATLDRLAHIIDSSKSLVLINFKGLSVVDTGNIRKKLREKKVSYLVAKNTLIKKALSKANISGDLPFLKGETAVVYGDDLLLPAQEIFVFQKKLDKKVLITGGVFEGKFMDGVSMTAVANIPSQKILYAQFVNIINSPISRFAVALDQIAKTKN